MPFDPAVELYVGGHASQVQGEKQNLGGLRCFTAAHPPQSLGPVPNSVRALLDSGAFSDLPHKRLSYEAALERQLKWEHRASKLWGWEFRTDFLASYDLLIDETWVAGKRHKRRWAIEDAHEAVQVSVRAAEYLASCRRELQPRKLVLGVQGVDALQYEECVRGVLDVAAPGDWIGLGGWCILGRFTSWLPTFWASMRRVLPLIASAGVRHVHLYGVLYVQAVGGLLWLCDREGIALSVDSSAPILACTRKDMKKSGARHHYWRQNVQWWQHTMASLRSSEHYKEPPVIEARRQLSLELVA
jgi:hypothetical protein